MNTDLKPWKKGSVMQKALMFAGLFIIGICLIYGVFALFNPHTTPMHTPIEWGVYSGEASDVHALEEKVGKTADIAATFVATTEPFPKDFADVVVSASTTPLIFLESPDGSSLKDVAGGAYDANLQQFAADAAAFGKPIILVPFNEPNLNESAWGFGTTPDNTAANFKLAWAHLHGIFASAPNVKFGIAYNNVSIPDDPDNTFESLYPGDNLVDYVGIDGFNWQEDGAWQSFDETIGSTTEELKALGKPIYLFSIGTGEDTAGDPSLKAQWVSDMFAWLKEHSEVKGFVWFNEDKSDQGEKNWLIDSNPQALNAFKQGLENL